MTYTTLQSFHSMQPSMINPVSEKIYYELPVTKAARLFMRFEQLFTRILKGLESESEWEIYFALMNLLQLYELTARGDLKAEALRELDRQIFALNAVSPQTPGEPLESGNTQQAHLYRLKSQLSQMHGTLGAHLRNHDLFNAIRQRATMPGGINAFDIPAYNHWINQPAKQRIAIFEAWIKPFQTIYQPITAMLNITRNSSNPVVCVAESGYYDQLFGNNSTAQMLRVTLPKGSPYFPEVSAGKQRFSIRFFEPTDLSKRPGQTAQDITFELTLCSI